MLKPAATLAFLIAALPAAAQSVSGTVTKVDEAQGKLTINHGPIKNLDMDAMTMVFKAGEPEMLKGLKAGTKVKFDADRVNGQITVIKLQKAK
jgi:Cu(I)/Ag(I) efflux system protein CusF